jgi:lipopolysaccharide heptosyltransferase I
MNFSRTLIIKPSSMGDVVQALPVLTALREAHPEARISWLVSSACADLLEGHPRLDEVILFDRRLAGAFWNPLAWGEVLRLRRDLRRRAFTAVLDLQGLFRSGLFAWWTGAADRVGFREARELAPVFYTDTVAAPHEALHAVDRYMALARHVGLADPKATDHLPVPPAARAAARRRLASEGLAEGDPFAVVSAHARWETKVWPPERFAEVLHRLWAAKGARGVLVGHGADADALGRAIAQRAAGARPIDLTNRTTLKELVAIAAEARAMVTNDSGPMHVAAAVGTPVVAIFGPTNPDRTGPHGPGHRVLARRAVCSPCYRRRCPLAGGPQALVCLTNVGADEVARDLIAVWDGPAPAPRPAR